MSNGQTECIPSERTPPSSPRQLGRTLKRLYSNNSRPGSPQNSPRDTSESSPVRDNAHRTRSVSLNIPLSDTTSGTSTPRSGIELSSHREYSPSPSRFTTSLERSKLDLYREIQRMRIDTLYPTAPSPREADRVVALSEKEQEECVAVKPQTQIQWPKAPVRHATPYPYSTAPSSSLYPSHAENVSFIGAYNADGEADHNAVCCHCLIDWIYYTCIRD